MTLAIAGYMAAETTFSTDPSADGSGYTPIATSGPIEVFTRQLAMLNPDRAVGPARRTLKRPGSDGAELRLRLPGRGFAALAAVGAAPNTTDAFDLIMNSAFGPAANVNGIQGNASTTTSLFVQAAAGDSLNQGDAIAHYTPGTADNRIQWRVIDAEATGGQYQHRAVIGPVGVASTSIGYRRWSPNVVPVANNGPSLAVHLVMPNGDASSYEQWTLLGGRPTSISRTIAADEESYVEVTIKFDRVVNGDKASLPVIGAFSPGAILGNMSTVVWGGTAYETSRVKITWQLGTADRKAVTAANGRSDIRVRSADVDIEIAPPLAVAWENDFTAGTTRRIEIIEGASAVAGGVANSVFFFAEAAQVSGWQLGDDANEPRHTLPIEVVDPNTYAGGALARYWALCRA